MPFALETTVVTVLAICMLPWILYTILGIYNPNPVNVLVSTSTAMLFILSTLDILPLVSTALAQCDATCVVCVVLQSGLGDQLHPCHANNFRVWWREHFFIPFGTTAINHRASGPGQTFFGLRLSQLGISHRLIHLTAPSSLLDLNRDISVLN